MSLANFTLMWRQGTITAKELAQLVQELGLNNDAGDAPRVTAAMADSETPGAACAIARESCRRVSRGAASPKSPLSSQVSSGLALTIARDTRADIARARCRRLYWSSGGTNDFALRACLKDEYKTGAWTKTR